MIKLLKSKKALSPVVAAIILIAVTVAVSIAVAAWMGSMTFTFMETEELKITTVSYMTNATGSYAIVTVMNTGTTDVVINSATVTGPGITSATIASTSFSKGTTNPVTLTLDAAYTTGSAYKVEILSTKGNRFSYTGTA